MSDMKIAVWLRRESCAYMVVNALCQIFVNRKLDKIFGNNFFSSIIRSGLPRIFSFGALSRKGRKMLCVFYHYNTKAFSCKAFFRYTKPPERTGAYSSASCAVTWRCSTEVENTICVRVRPKCCSSPINWSSSMVLTKRPSMSME